MAVKSAKPDRKRTLSSEPPLPCADASSKTHRANRGSAHAERSDSRKPPRPVGVATTDSTPDITLHRQPLERSALDVIAHSLANQAQVGVRPKLDTMDYEDRPSEHTISARCEGSSPELIVIGEAPVGRSTMHAIESELQSEADAFPDPPTRRMAPLDPAPKPPRSRPSQAPAERRESPATAEQPDPAQMFEVATFVVVGGGN